MDLNENQKDMLEFLSQSSKDSPVRLTVAFAMGSNEVAEQKQNYTDYLGLFTSGLIGSDRNGEWITEMGLQILEEVSVD